MLKKSVLCGFLVLTAVACKNGADAAGKYNDRIIELSNGCVVRQQTLLEFTEKADAGAAKAALENLRSYTEKARDSLKAVEAPDGAESLAFKKAAEAYMDNLINTCKNEYEIYTTLHFRPDSLFTENDQLLIDSIATLINNRDSIADFEFNRAQKKFAQKYGITIQ